MKINISLGLIINLFKRIKFVGDINIILFFNNYEKLNFYPFSRKSILQSHLLQLRKLYIRYIFLNLLTFFDYLPLFA